MTKKLKIILIIISILILCSFFLYHKNKQIQKFFANNQITSAYYDIVENQKEINQKLDKIAKNPTYTFENAYLELNPYQISPLSGIIIFTTKEEENIEVYLEEEKIYTSEKAKIHTLPIYGLFENKKNKITLKKGNDYKDYFFTTEKSNLAPLNILEKSPQLNSQDFYFMTASYISGLSAYDQLGNLRFYLTEDYRMDIEWLPNGHFIIGIPDSQFAENFYGFVEMDYLGKIYNYYTLEHGFSFESQILSNGNYLIAGGKTPVYIKEQVIAEINPQNGQTVKAINLSQILKQIDPEFPDKYLGQAAIRNGFAYNESNQELIISFRGIDIIFSVNYDTEELNWIFTNPQNELFQKEIWQKYLVKSDDNNYPLGAHSPIITREGYLAFFNNGYERYNGFEVGGKDLVSDYKENFSRAEIYNIKNKVATKIWSYDENKKYFSHQYGSIKIDEMNNKLINFGWTLNEEYRENPNATLSMSEKNIDNTHAYIVLLDSKDNLLLKATCDEGKYRVFKHPLYSKTNTNLDFLNLKEYSSILQEKIYSAKISLKDLTNTEDFLYTQKLTQNYFETNYEIQPDDNIEFFFLTESGTIKRMLYKEKENSITKRIFNLKLPKGKYKFYIKINDTLWNTNQTIIF